MNILVSCANGSGTSLMMMKSVEKSMKKLGIPISKINHTSIAEGKSTASQYDAVFTPLSFVSMFEDASKKGVTVVGVKNVMSDKEITQRIIDETDFEEKYKK
ncbi:PTS sugar transporter subunit IIB [Leuconostoc mesenteroides]|uniref:PTS sugar transporter subunit IIB n=1 Tax=Leuconostoc mesenteroides TaxID=1245 RepID=UPI000E09224D|nr:PTS sugar transporter subunit IIB [Leuconostoc mesenteroides]MCJ2159925.1 PTS sugar transporter subunit IIB [Leuconostoc mesenteroides]MCM6836432.1 PTS sugar transporter subunit IIB [Leuconostoc mesenteroides]RDG15106.1 PTS ascorbate transporter subunit IIB [Leuconostoc mesenteroides subsp. mesenteroides]